MRFNNKKVLLVGDFVLNQFFYGTAIGVAKDAPIPIINVSRTELALGASGIVAEALSKFGVKVTPIGIVGNDGFGTWLRNKLSKTKIHSRNILVNSKIKTPITSRVIANSIQTARFDQIIQHEFDPRYEQKLLKVTEREIADVDFVIVSDYGYGTISKRISDRILKETKKNHQSLFVSSIGNNYLKYKNSNAIIKINMENSLLLIKETEHLPSNKILNRLEEILQLKKILLTRSHEGIAVYEDGMVTEMPATQNKVLDIKGIGEVMIAAIIFALLNNYDFLEACKLGNIAAGVAASKGSIELISKNEIMKAKKEYDEWLDQK